MVTPKTFSKNLLEDWDALKVNLEKNKTERLKTIPGIVFNNLALLLRDSDFKTFYKTYFKIENPNALKSNHITIWARAMINENQKELIQYDGKDITIQDQLLEMDKFTLEKHVVKALKEILGMDE
ncbi:hypothetical protein Bealeia1_01879 [Candidatus Bealeia paramacronuclearis]|uniref:Uncharacterized protein n=1 Tax=Candidatus Bealeia paramacronuclearis TaxID=1921001 RepID=A0ABZ2C897_9PROT|nr:hypothetical protein [Candidatus Bealeia paramacronuclearis]